MIDQTFGSAELSDNEKVQKLLTKVKVRPNRTFGRSLMLYVLQETDQTDCYLPLTTDYILNEILLE